MQIYRQVPASISPKVLPLIRFRCKHLPSAPDRGRRSNQAGSSSGQCKRPVQAGKSGAAGYQTTGRDATVTQNFSNAQKLTGLKSDAHHTITGRIWH